ncbi:MAG: response regulator [Acidobacteriota bacterium]
MKNGNGSQKNCIVIAEDDDLTGELIEAVAARPGRQVLRANDGEAALRLIREHQPQLVVLDLFIPIRGGMEVLRLARKEGDPKRPRVLVLSAQGQLGTEEEARRSGADDFLAKPFIPGELAARIDRLLGKEAVQ